MRKSNWIISPGIKQKYMFETTTQWVTGWTNPPSKWRYNNPTYNLLTGAHSPNKASFRKPVSGFHHLWSYSKLSYDTNHEILDSKKKVRVNPSHLGFICLHICDSSSSNSYSIVRKLSTQIASTVHNGHDIRTTGRRIAMWQHRGQANCSGRGLIFIDPNR